LKIIYHSLNEYFVNNVVDLIKQSAESAIKAKGKFHFVLTGGETPKQIYKKLKDLETDWSAWEFYISDERIGHLSENQINQSMVRNEFLNHVSVLESQIHFIENNNDIQLALISYSLIISKCTVFDLTLLGIGEDGHVASLFPGHDLGLKPESPDVLPVYNSPKLPAQRISLSINRLNRSQKIFIIASGVQKNKIVADYCEGIDIPALHIKALEETILLYCTT
jgi:6-phosphogluconolactonase